MANEKLLYQIGKFVGSKVKEASVLKNIITFKIDQTNGDNTSNGIDIPTTSFFEVLSEIDNYILSKVEIQNSPSAVIINSIFGISNAILVSFNATANDNPFKLVFDLNADNSLLGKLVIRNSRIEFYNFEFAIASGVENNQGKFNLLLTPFFVENSTITFRNCKFSYDGDSGKKIAFIAGINSTIQAYNCTFTGSFTFFYGSNPKVPNLFIEDGSNVDENVDLIDKNSSAWISYSVPTTG